MCGLWVLVLGSWRVAVLVCVSVRPFVCMPVISFSATIHNEAAKM